LFDDATPGGIGVVIFILDSSAQPGSPVGDPGFKHSATHSSDS
jgi:hypothetical protein